ncbi:MAG: site-specific integrase [Acidobacteriia bacterium]|nr:site-specific integrase [Terriglobia bacterium]
MGRYQRGYIYEAFGAFHVRYRLEEIVDGKLVRKQHSKRLCTKRKGLTTSSKPVRRLCDEFMATINTQVPGQPEPADIPITSFWELTYWPFVVENLKPSTQWGYKQVWNQHLKPHFGNMTLREYRTPTGSVFLTALSKKFARRTVQTVRSLASGIFSHAVNLGAIESNPWHDVKVLGKTKTPAATKHYTLEEIENVISALVDHVDCQLIMALSYFLGLRKGEISGLQWGDIDDEWLHVRRALSRGKVDTTKTEKSNRSLPLIQPVKGLLMLWRAKCEGEQVWVFQNERGNPLSMDYVAVKTIRPALANAKLEWKAFHAGRRGLGTVLRQITGNSTAGRDVLGHEDERLTKDHYEGKLPEVALGAMKLLEAKALKS